MSAAEKASIEARKHEPEKHEPPKPADKPPDPHERPHDPAREPHKPPETVPSEPESSTVAMSADQFQRIMVSVIQEARKPIVDERAVQARERMKAQNRRLRVDRQAMLLAKFHSCNHMQMPGSVMTGCACIAWAIQSDNVKRGTCQHCGTKFSPILEECDHPEIWEAYKYLVRLPTHPAGNINNIFQTA